ncbi:MAG: flagellar FliJ family protein [Rubrivivax sp.]|nr:flagellar FliJ family protein [Rubrivivax sp.]
MPPSDPRALDTVLQHEQRQRDLCWRALREAEQRQAQVLAQSEALRSYREETARRWATPEDRVCHPQQLQTARAFLQRLDDALAQQQRAESACLEQANERRSALMAAELRVAMIEKLVERRRLALLLHHGRQEQKAFDESAQQAYARAAAARPSTESPSWQEA